MQIVPQSAKPLPFPFSAQSTLLLPAPRIAGLLPAPKNAPPPIIDELCLHELRLGQLTTLEYARVFTAFRALLTAAIDFMLGETLRAELYAAEQAFHETLSGEAVPPKTQARAGLKKRLDAFWKDSEARMAAAEIRIAAEQEALYRKYHIEPDVIDVPPTQRGGQP